MSLSSTATQVPVCGNCGAQRAAADFRCSDCGKILPSMLQMPTSTGVSYRASSHSGAASDVNLFKRLFTPEGRLGRLQFFLANLILGALQTLLGFVVLLPMIKSLTGAVIEAQLNPEAAVAGVSFGPFIMSGVLLLLGSLFLVWSFCCLASQRSHDLGKPGTYSLFSLIPFLNIYWAFVWCLAPGQRGANTYGPDPLG
jgi:uncharacterized membrane protein YhaH (DUF805 family)